MPEHSRLDDTDQVSRPNRAKTVQGRSKQRRYAQGTRSSLHAMANSVVKRLASKTRKRPWANWRHCEFSRMKWSNSEKLVGTHSDRQN
jgi:hypothetical protein